MKNEKVTEVDKVDNVEIKRDLDFMVTDVYIRDEEIYLFRNGIPKQENKINGTVPIGCSLVGADDSNYINGIIKTDHNQKELNSSEKDNVIIFKEILIILKIIIDLVIIKNFYSIYY